jgi:phosphoribosylglycinamide formyltransferase 2
MEPNLLQQAHTMAADVTAELGGSGIWGVEFFIQNPKNGQPGTVYFSELSPRPHDTGMVTLAGTQNFTEFELHARAILGLPVSTIVQQRPGASAVVLAPESLAPHAGAAPVITGLCEAATEPNSDLRVFGKPTVRPYRRMAVAVTHGAPGDDVIGLVTRAKAIAGKIQVDAQR